MDPQGITPLITEHEEIETKSKTEVVDDQKNAILSKYDKKYSYMVLAIITLVSIATQWQQKSIGYFYGFSGVGEMKGNPKFEISSAYPQMDTYYGLLVGLCYSVPYALSGLYAGSLTKSGNRKLMMVAVVGLLSMF